MTAVRTAEVVVESASAPTTRARTAEVYVEAAANPTTRARTAEVYVEMVVRLGPTGWAQGITPW